MEENLDQAYDWMMSGPAWIRYNYLKDVLGRSEEDSSMRAARREVLQDPQVLRLILEIEEWETSILKRHNDAAHPIHKLCFLADIGLNIHDEGVGEMLEKILRHISEEGIFQVLSNYPKAFGGSGKDEWLWCLCDAPLIMIALQKLGLGSMSEINAGLDHLASLIRENGWPCKACSKMENFKGPGNKQDVCPYANLIMLRALALRSNQSDQQKIKIGGEAALSLWENSQEKHPYLFKMGNDFRKLKVPFIWYDILHLAEAISMIPKLHQDQRFLQILETITKKADASFHFRSESIWTKWIGWEFCQKKEPSRWVTFVVWRILKRTGRWPKNPASDAG